MSSVHSTTTQTWRAPELTDRSRKPATCIVVLSRATTEVASRVLTVNTLTDQSALPTIQVSQHNKHVSSQQWMYIDPVMMLAVKNASSTRGAYTARGWYGTRICAWWPNVVLVFLSPSTRILGGLLKAVYDHSCNVIFPLSWYVRPQSQAVKWLDFSRTTGAGTCCLHLQHFSLEDGASGLHRNVVT